MRKEDLLYNAEFEASLVDSDTSIYVFWVLSEQTGFKVERPSDWVWQLEYVDHVDDYQLIAEIEGTKND